MFCQTGTLAIGPGIGLGIAKNSSAYLHSKKDSVPVMLGSARPMQNVVNMYILF